MRAHIDDKTRKKYTGHVKCFVALCVATGWRARFEYTQLAGWCVFYVGQGYSVRSIPGHLSAFAKIALEEGVRWPKAGSTTHEKLNRLIRGIRKETPGAAVRRAFPLTKVWLKRMLAVVGIRKAGDWATVPMAVLLTAARLLAAQECMMRMCEHRDGMARSDVHVGKRATVLKVPEVKDKLRTGTTRDGEMARHKSATSAAWGLESLVRRLGPAEAGDVLFPAVVDGVVMRKTAGSEATFRKNIRAWAEAAGMVDWRRVTTHSMRAGGATDYLSSGVVSAAWVKRQGGWKSNCYMIYYRPATAEMGAMAEKLKEVERRMLGG